ncbi:MAG: three-Cys-motif partner protein TcmP [Gammaproteobacteria bacterium]|nr:three-Cys-motif partner protein TcmP [Gammaproteobacteria bacterium]MDE0252077.1 three-Cys-motif partner protein TcmP [Gammaproteobacteria bacterium]MDE0402814.1 three-Cys-motif partner protein TcmP [Gammaproteobacteria bacterium]
MTQQFGGKWTKEKLAILDGYLNAYTSVFKNKKFKIVYIDAFAGTGKIQTTTDLGMQQFLRGSASIALEVSDRPFDTLVFIEQDSNKCKVLENKCAEPKYAERNTRIINDDANTYLTNLKVDWSTWRGVLFLDPFATEVNWHTIETIANFEALDTWILFPVSAVSRMLPVQCLPEKISEKLSTSLDTIYGDDSWKNLYGKPPTRDLFDFDQSARVRLRGVEGLLSIYKAKLKREFGKRFLARSKTLKNSKNSAMFELIFCVGNSDGIAVAKRIADHLLKDL